MSKDNLIHFLKTGKSKTSRENILRYIRILHFPFETLTGIFDYVCMIVGHNIGGKHVPDRDKMGTGQIKRGKEYLRINKSIIYDRYNMSTRVTFVVSDSNKLLLIDIRKSGLGKKYTIKCRIESFFRSENPSRESYQTVTYHSGSSIDGYDAEFSFIDSEDYYIESKNRNGKFPDILREFFLRVFCWHRKV